MPATIRRSAQNSNLFRAHGIMSKHNRLRLLRFEVREGKMAVCGKRKLSDAVLAYAQSAARSQGVRG